MNCLSLSSKIWSGVWGTGGAAGLVGPRWGAGRGAPSPLGGAGRKERGRSSWGRAFLMERLIFPFSVERTLTRTVCPSCRKSWTSLT